MYVGGFLLVWGSLRASILNARVGEELSGVAQLDDRGRDSGLPLARVMRPFDGVVTTLLRARAFEFCTVCVVLCLFAYSRASFP